MKVTATTTYIMATHIACLVGYISFTTTTKTRIFLLYEDKKFNSGKISFINLSDSVQRK